MRFFQKILHVIQSFIFKNVLEWMTSVEDAVVAIPGSFKSTDQSPLRFNILAEGLRLQDGHLAFSGFPRTSFSVASSLYHIGISIAQFKNNPLGGKKEVSTGMLHDLAAFARSLHVEVIGFADVPREWVFQDKAILFQHAVLLVMEMDKACMASAPSRETAIMVFETYDKLGRAANKIAGWLRERGFAAHAGHPLNGMVLYPPLAQRAGLGWRGMSGLLITPQYGPRVRLAAVFTEMTNLPLVNSDEHAWIAEYCERCRRCLRECPPGAIVETPITHDNHLVTTVDSARCFPYFAEHYGCSICIKVCPFNQMDYDVLRESVKSI